jgi:hypothetical protein
MKLSATSQQSCSCELQNITGVQEVARRESETAKSRGPAISYCSLKPRSETVEILYSWKALIRPIGDAAAIVRWIIPRRRFDSGSLEYSAMLPQREIRALLEIGPSVLDLFR